MMKEKIVVLVSNDLDLHRMLVDTGLFGDVMLATSLDNVNTCDLLIVSDKLVMYNDFIEIYENKYRAIPYVFYMLSSSAGGQNKYILDVLKSKGVNCIPPKMTTQQIIEKICSDAGLSQMANNNIAVFLGADSKVGTTITTQAIAETIAANTNGKVALLYLNGQPSVDYLKDSKDTYGGLDSIKVKIINKVLSSNELQESFIKIDNLYVLPGANNLLDIRYFGNEHIENLIQLSASMFSVVIIDAGCKVFNGMTIGSINSTNHRYLVATQQDTVLSNYERTCNQVFSELDIATQDFFLIVNKYVEFAELNTPSQLATIYKTSLLGTLPMLDYGWQAERERSTLLKYESAAYNRQIYEISKIISNQVGIDFKDAAVPKVSFLKRIFG
jgi:MinD-like ATPase involved in chromosome partitioning or flagellar assembly